VRNWRAAAGAHDASLQRDGPRLPSPSDQQDEDGKRPHQE
jgi:hypothetical protein